MSEFYFQGMPRFGYGFYNPNHAAALICAILPVLWGWARKARTKGMRAGLALLMALLAAALIFTYSRTGILVLLLEAGCAAYSMRKNPVSGYFRRIAPVFCAIFAVVFFSCGLAKRFTLDDAFLNRFIIWKAGAELYASNYLSGTGLGESGKIVSTFLLPERIQCRTLVNSHLTLFAEFGIFAAFVWCAFLVYALLRNKEDGETRILFASYVLSAFVSSVFDFDILFHRPEQGMTVNYFFAWFSFLLFLIAGIRLCAGGFTWKRLFLSMTVSLIAVTGMIPLFHGSAPEFQKEWIVMKNEKSMPLVLYDEAWKDSEILPFLRFGYRMAKHPVLEPPVFAGKEVYLFGTSAEYASSYPEQRITFIDPPELWDPPENTDAIYLRRGADEISGSFPVQYF